MCELFKDMIGMTLNKYVQYLRHQPTKTLLRETDYKTVIEYLHQAL